MNRPAQRLEDVLQILLFALLLIGCFLVVQPFLPALLLAVVVALSTWPAYSWIEARLGRRRSLAALVMCLLFVVLLVGPIVILSASAADAVGLVIDEARRRVGSGGFGPPDWLRELPVIGDELAERWLLLAQSRSELLALLQRLAEPARGVALTVAAGLGSGVVQMAVAVFLLFFFYRDGETLGATLRRAALRLAGPVSEELFRTAQNTVLGVMQGMIGTAAAQAVVATIGFFIAGVPGALLLGALTFFGSLVPVGPPLIWGGAALWLAERGEIGWALFMAAYGFFAISSVDNVVKPLLISRTSSLPLPVALLGVIGGVLAFGVVGIFVGPTLLALALNLGQRWLEMRARPEAGG